MVKLFLAAIKFPVLVNGEQNSFDLKRKIKERMPIEKSKINKILNFMKSTYAHSSLLKLISSHQMDGEKASLIISKREN